jgi:hypothetical protein
MTRGDDGHKNVDLGYERCSACGETTDDLRAHRRECEASPAKDYYDEAREERLNDILDEHKETR